MFSIIRNQKVRNATLQGLFLLVLAVVIGSAVITARATLDEQGITSGFGFLDRSTGFNIGFSLVEYSASDTYGRLIWVGILNTILLGLTGIVLANIVGLIIAIFRTSTNAVLNAFGTVYVEFFRNIPMILQVFFWYALLTHLPGPKQAYNVLDLFYATSRGFYFPGLNISSASVAACGGWLVFGLSVVAWFAVARRFSKIPQAKRRVLSRVALTIIALVALTILVLGRIPDTPLLSIPVLKGLNLRDGLLIPPEFSALAIGMAIYGGAYLAEIFRSGFISVKRGQIEAARSLGLKPWYVFSRVRLPLAIRAILPTLINQYVWLFKATTLGIVVGFTDFFSVISVSITQSGQTLELIGILMVGFLIMNNTMSLLLNRVNKAIKLKGTQLRI